MAKPENYTEEQLVKGCVANNRFYQEALYRRYFPAMLRMCMRYTQDRDVAMDILNAGFLRVFKKIDTFAFKGSLEGWVRRLIFHSLSDYFRNQNQSVYFLDVEERDAPVREASTNNLYFEDLIKLVDMLPDATRQVFYLYAIEGYSHAEIGEQLGISDGTSKWHLSTARKKLKELIHLYDNSTNYAG